MNLKLIFISLILLSGIVLLNSCDSDLVISENKAIIGSWDKNEPIDFSFEIFDTLAWYDFYINIRHSEEYAYRNIYFFVNTEFPNGNVSRDTIECMLADLRGKWYGNGYGNIRENKILIRRNLQFQNSGLYRIDFIQAMREDKLQGLSDIGILIDKSSAN